ncbi:Ig-like protein group 2 [Pseudomonas sp. IT-347P]|uniref:hypothetical protein n=1 Tax=Pseudomonas sp. IT-347P TaxID=3026458 RepID=UPI0039E0F37A
MPSDKRFRFPPMRQGNEPLALRPLLIPGMVAPVQDGDGGINFKGATGDPEGLLCVINPYLEPMKENDKLEIWWNHEKVLERFVTADEANNNRRVFFYLPAPAESGWAEDCHYVLTRVGETQPEPPSASLRVLIKLYKPGNRDKEPHLPEGHSELNIAQLPPELIEQGVIDAEWARDGVPVTIPHYVYCTRNDKIRLRVGDYLLPAHLITQDQADDKQPIEIRLEQEHILRAGDGLKREIKYDINDEVWNWADRHSKRTHINIDAGGWYLESPLFKEAFEGKITIRNLNKQPVTVQIHVIGKYFDLGDSLEMTFIGTPPGNVEPIVCSETREIDNIPSVLEIKVPYDLIRTLAEGSADASYILYKKDGGDPLSSKRIKASVVGDVNMLPEPTIRELIGDTLEPDEHYATVDVRYGMKNGDLICLRWYGTRSNGDEYEHEVPHIVSDNEAKEGLITFYIDAEHIAALDNGTLDLSYVVANDAPGLLDVRESERLLAKVEKARATLPRPEVEEAEPPGDVLDPSKVFDSVHVLIGAEANTVSGDVLTYYWRSPIPLASTGDWVPITTVSEGEPVRFRVDKKYVTSNIGQYVHVRYVLWRAVSQRYEYSATLVLLIGELVGDLPAPDVIQAVDGVLNPMHGLNGVDVSVSYPSMNADQDMIRLRWLGAPGAGTSDDLELPGHASGTVQFPMPRAIVGANIAKRVSIDYLVTRYMVTTPSDMSDLYVSNFQDPENELPRPRIPQAKDDTLDLMEFTGDVTALLETWPFIDTKQCIWFFVDGTTTAGQSYRIPILDGVEINPAQIIAGLDEVLRRSELMKLGHSTPASVGCKVAFDGTRNETSAIEFPRRQVTVRTRYDYVTPVITRVEDVRGEIEEGGKTRADEVIISGTATRGETIELFDAGSTSKGTAPVKDDSRWRATISTPTEKLYSITAKALYDADPVSSDPRTFTVKFTQTPEILSLTDSRGSVAPGATTYDNSVLVMGSATPNLQIELRDSDQPIITLDVDDDGNWQHRINNLKVGDYSLVATAKYEVDPPSSPARTFKVAQAVTPTISRVSDIRGEIDPGGTTYYRSVTLTGKASPNETITLLDTTTVIDRVAVPASGDWQYTFSSLDLKGYSLTARAEYGSNPVSDPPRVFKVETHVSPTITSVKDSVGEVAQNQNTYDSTVNLVGTGTPREQIQLYDKGGVIGSPVTVDANKQWRGAASSLTIAEHSLTAKALYEVTPVESPARVFKVAAHIAPTLTSVHDGVSEVGRETKSRSVTLRGRVTPNHEVQIHDNNIPLHKVRAAGDAWNTTLAVGLGAHSVNVKAVSTGQYSSSRSFNVISPIPPLNFNTNPVTLSGKIYLIPGSAVLPAFGPGTSVQHQASGGQPPYTYSTSNGNVAVVDSASGLVTARGNGSATISVRDAASQARSYTVSVTGVTQCYGLGANWWANVGREAQSRGLRLPSMAELRAISGAFGNRWPLGNSFYWSNESKLYWPNPNPFYYCRNLVTGEEKTIMNMNVVPGVGITP